MENLKITKIGEDYRGGIFEIEVPQGNGTTYVYKISENDLNWLKGGKSIWEVRYVASLVRTV